MRANMATRNLGNVNLTVIGECTEFQLHVSQQSTSTKCNNVIDYTEYRLNRYADKVTDAQQKRTINDLIENYRKGLIAVAWRAGFPQWLQVTKDS
jgi:glycosylphosphatidylinositol transamidase (GPIT) subunit GPI8